MISRLSFENFKSLAKVDLELDRLTILVGPNAAGKSSLLEATHLLSSSGVPIAGEHRHAWRRFAWIFGELSRSPWRLATAPGLGPLRMGMAATDGEILSLSIEIPKPLGKEHLAHTEWDATFTLSVDGPKGPPLRQVISTPVKGTPSPASDEILEDPRVTRFGSSVYLHMDAAVMAQVSFVQDEAPRMAPNGYGLASTLAYLAGAQPEVLERIAADLAKVIPGVRRIRTFRVRVQDQALEQLEVERQAVWRAVDRVRVGDRFAIEFAGVGNIAADLLSEGTVLALGLITKLHEPEAPRLVLLDDIDRGLHIAAQARLVDVLRRLMEARADLQLVCTTHSPYLLSRCQPEEVRVLALDGERHTQLRRLTEHPEFTKLKYGFQTGEIWAALGEDWVGSPRVQEGADVGSSR